MTQRKRFSQAAPEEVYRAIGAKRLQSKEITAKQKPVSTFFEERLKRLQNFDLRSSERAKELLIDACLEEAIFDHPGLKIWKAAPLKDELFNGTADYLIAPKQDFLSTPLLCVVEAKKDDFEQGRLQCLAEMRACRWNNLQQKLQLDLWGIVTNADVWRFYGWPVDGKPWESPPYAFHPPNQVLGILSTLMQQCADEMEHSLESNVGP